MLSLIKHSNHVKMSFSHMYLREIGTKEKNIVTYTTDVKHDKKKQANKKKTKTH